MRIHGIYLVKNEADIVRHSLRESARWCDRIYVYDNGSSDDTWARAEESARELPQVVLFKREDKPFDDALRAEVFRAYRDDAQAGDWWCRLDADEFYIDEPRAFLARVPPSQHVVWAASLLYYLTRDELARFTPEDERLPPEITSANLPRYYSARASEARFFRHRPRLEWDGGSWPAHLGLVSPQRIRLKHFQYRSPAQIQRRLDTRRLAKERGWHHFEHSTQMDWREKIAHAAELHLDRGDGTYVIDEGRMPRHLEAPLQRAMKRVMHGLHVWP